MGIMVCIYIYIHMYYMYIYIYTYTYTFLVMGNANLYHQPLVATYLGPTSTDIGTT